MKEKIKTAVICFFTASKGGHGSAEVSLGIFKSIKGQKKLFEFQESKKKDSLVKSNVKKIFFLILTIFHLKKFFRGKNKNIIFIEGASWIGFSFLFVFLSRILLKNIFIVYHAHNVEYEIRLKKNNILISFISKIFEKYVYKKSNVATSVSKYDQKIIKNLYGLNSYVFINGVSADRLRIKKIRSNIPKQFYLYTGSYLYNPNKIALDELINYIYPKLIKKYPNLYLIVTGKGLPNNLIKNKKIIHFKFLKKEHLNYLIKKANFLLLPLEKAPGTKLKVIEALLIGSQIITTKHGIRGIQINNSKQPYIYKNYHQLFNYISNLMNKNIKREKSLDYKSEYYKENFLIENIIKRFQSKYYS